jgi:hypothetical protein
LATGRIPANGRTVAPRGPIGAAPATTWRYVNRVGSDGWLLAQHRDTGRLVPLPKYTRLKVESTKAGRTYFVAMEGAAAGQTLSLGVANAEDYLGSIPPVQGLATAVVTYGKYVEGWVSKARRGERLDQQMAELRVGAVAVQVTMNSVWGRGFSPIPNGDYTVLLPDVPHQAEMTRFYRGVEPSLKYDQVWFPIRYGDNSRYVHVGNLSEGCTTVLDLARWADVHEALISHRSADGGAVARLTVQGKPERAR